MDNQIQLRFKARLNTNKPEDVNRLFIIVFFLNNDTLGIYEENQKNSGFAEGKFLEINQYKNKATDKFYAPGDLIVGKDVIINSYSLHIIDCDEFTRKWYLKNMG